MNSGAAPASRLLSVVDKPMTRRGCIVGVVVWLLVMTLPLCALIFAIRGEFTWQRGPFVEDRVWLVNLSGQPGEESAGGIGYSSMRVVRTPTTAGGPTCAETHVYFLLWRGHSDPVAYCECFQPRPGTPGAYDVVGQCT